ncbi:MULTISPECIES: hypothetical protein [Pseudomonas]|uniref:Transposase n=2 Tax=Pseudomonas TaxID=286 RepID=A0ABX9AUV4_9PSED|nr:MULTISPECIES: hypothetical protein [Pseudomonas]EGC00428.1 hypothetical protein G1E_03165 [Pseudomonas sp. TJI-51]MBA6121621.1 hypothetical protein [Pseudomonas juntendi]MBF8708698.1 hypothetical protein [Pseudomonas putida]MCF3155432.1 hypothetical protein [Pseudomonas juntendi]MCI0911130.1 hypothetical protein [Pseudomonas putida]
MASKPAAAHQAKRYTQDDRRVIILEYFNSGLSLTKFCKVKGRPSYQTMKLWLCISPDFDEGNMHSPFNSKRPLSESMDTQSEHQTIQTIAGRLALLHIQLAAIQEEIDSLNQKSHLQLFDIQQLERLRATTKASQKKLNS